MNAVRVAVVQAAPVVFRLHVNETPARAVVSDVEIFHDLPAGGECPRL